ncbi:hypothetical protein PXH59_18485 [Xenorhabdus sp. SF857]|uniref:hypothetical protein n=1 Tax=Xenorhabdus bakwenae TaxID=3026967 RepID=UPI00255825BB|nr:hypothetical protein [Xenorhabdus sp. SF857]WFQ79518.1 hypothetical protein PXH59_18485 [Xenorhabdus sp. SF857]
MRSDLYSFSHLRPDANRARGYTGRYVSWRSLDVPEPQEEHATDTHSNAHWIASSQEAKNNPVYALHLIDNHTSHESAIEMLSESYRHLSQYTTRKMEAACSGWELLDDKDKNQEAFNYSMRTDDANGYRASLRAAGEKLEQYIEPMTGDEIQALIQRTSDFMHRNNPHSAESIAGRQRQEKEEERKAYEEQERQGQAYRWQMLELYRGE